MGWTAAAVAIPLAVSAAVYAPILGSYFFADDFYNFVRIADRGCARFAVEPMAGHVLLARNLVMCLQYDLFGLGARWYFAVVLATHLLNVWLLFRVIRLLTRRRAVACVSATLWGACPLHAEPLSWYSVYGHVLSCTVMLAVLAVVLSRTDRGDRGPSPGVAVACGVLLLLAATCFGTGLAIAVTVPVLILAMVPAARQGGVGSALLLTSLSTPLLYLGLRWVARRTGESSWVNEAALATAVGHLGAAPAMLLHLLRHALLGVVAGPWASVVPNVEALSWVLLALAALAIGAAIATGGAANRRAVLSMLVLCLAIYGVVALGRASISEMRGGPGVVAAVQRYHYAGSAALIMCLAAALSVLPRGRRSALLLAVTMGGLVVANAWALYDRPVTVDQRPQIRQLVTARLASVDASIRMAAPGDTVHLQNQALPRDVVGVFGPHLLPGTAALALIANRTDQPLGRNLRFWETEAVVRQAFRSPTSRWLSRMLVPPRVHLAGSTPSACEVVAAKRILALARELLRCEREAVAGRVDVVQCHAAAQEAYERTAITCHACFDPKALVSRIRTGVDVGRWWLRCMNGPDAAPPPARCSEANVAAIQRLIDGLFACHRRSILRDRLLDDTPCEDRASAAYRAHLAGLRPDCGPCFEDILAFGARWQVARVFADVFCGALGPPTDGGAVDPARP